MKRREVRSFNYYETVEKKVCGGGDSQSPEGGFGVCDGSLRDAGAGASVVRLHRVEGLDRTMGLRDGVSVHGPPAGLTPTVLVETVVLLLVVAAGVGPRFDLTHALAAADARVVVGRVVVLTVALIVTLTLGVGVGFDVDVVTGYIYRSVLVFVQSHQQLVATSVGCSGLAQHLQ